MEPSGVANKPFRRHHSRPRVPDCLSTDGTAFHERPELDIHAALRQVITPRSTIEDFGGGLVGLCLNVPEPSPRGEACLVIEQQARD